jgi:hypothetical protein
MTDFPATAAGAPFDRELALSLLSTYLFFLSRRPVSSSNTHYLWRRLAGLRSLAPHLETDGTPQLKKAAACLRSMDASSFRTLNRDLQFHLALIKRTACIPAHYIVTDRKPMRAFFQDTRRAVLICGPAIGIGDEIILFPLPQWLKATYPQIEVTVMSGYNGLWDRVNGPDRVCYFSTHDELLRAMRGQGPLGGFDLVVLADFEKPGLATVVASDPSIDRYLEISLGAQCCIAVDNVNQRVSARRMPLDTAINYYEAMERLLIWCGIQKPVGSRYDNLIRHSRISNTGPRRIFVSPFTSKYDPSVVYWSNLLGNIYAQLPRRPVEFHIDPGANLTTERFSVALARSAASRCARDVRFCIASNGHTRTLDLADVMSCIEASQVVICADSFAAHASPLFELPTLVVARTGLENWRTPAPGSYYFDVEQASSETAQGMRVLIDASAEELHGFPYKGMGVRLDQATATLSRALRESAKGSPLNGEYDDFVESYRDVISTLPDWPREYKGVLCDTEYGRVWRNAQGDLSVEAVRHLKDVLASWENTNLRKLLRLAVGTSARTAHI